MEISPLLCCMQNFGARAWQTRSKVASRTAGCSCGGKWVWVRRSGRRGAQCTTLLMRGWDSDCGRNHGSGHDNTPRCRYYRRRRNPVFKIWIRAEYTRIFNFLNAYCDIPVFQPRALGAVATGQPRIGECVASPDCFSNNAFCIKARVYGSITLYADASPKGSRSFGTSNGAATCSLKRVSATRCLLIFKKLIRLDLSRFRWSHGGRSTGSSPVQYSPFRHLLLSARGKVVASAQDGTHDSRNYESMENERESSVWPCEIVHTLRKSSASMYPLGRINESRTNEIFERLGPTCFDYQLNSLEMSQYEGNPDVAISEVTSDKLKSLLRTAASGDLRINALSHKITLLSRKSLDEVHSRTVVIPITPFIRSRLSNQFRNLAIV